MPSNSLWYPSVEDIIAIHDDIVSEYPDTPAGVRNRGDIAFTLTYIEDGHFDTVPETIHEKALHLLQLLVANHPFVDANKRTALNTTAVFYAHNGYRFEYDDEIRTTLKRFGTDEATIDTEETVGYLCTNTETKTESDSPLDNVTADTHQELARQVAATDRETNRDIYDALETE